MPVAKTNRPMGRERGDRRRLTSVFSHLPAAGVLVRKRQVRHHCKG
jgi:hypothetical protein